MEYRIQLLFLLLATGTCCLGQQYHGTCDRPRNTNLPFCDSSLSFDVRVQDLVSRLTLEEKMLLLYHHSPAATTNLDLSDYDWWNEALHGVAYGPGTHFRPPTQFATMFPQVVNLVSAFSKQLFAQVANTIGNEGRAFYNAGNSQTNFWSPNINIYRDPRWGRGHETPGEDPFLTSEYARLFVTGLQGNEAESGFLKTSACCKHFAAHSMDEGRFSFNAIVNKQDMADTYLPAFKTCVEEAHATCVMCSYNAINGIPACAHKDLLTGLLRDEWGFDGYVVADCGAVVYIPDNHNYTETGSQTCRAVLDAGLDLECGWWDGGDAYFNWYLRWAVYEGTIPEQWIDTAVSRLMKVRMRTGYFEKEATRPYKDLVPAIVDSQPHRDLALQAARESIVLLKNQPNVKTGQAPLPINAEQFRARRASMALIGPHLDGSDVFTGNYNGLPPFIRKPLDEIRKYVSDVEVERGCEVVSTDNARLQEAEDLARVSEQVILFVGLSPKEFEEEGRDRPDLKLPGLQEELIRRVLGVVQEPVIMFVVSGGAVDLSEWQNNQMVGAIIWAGYLGQSAGEAMADVMFGTYNPSGRLAQTFYVNEYINQVNKFDMNMRPVDGSPGRTYRFFTGQPVYPFGFGLSYTSFQYTLTDLPAGQCVAQFQLTVRNSGTRAGDHSVLWFLAPPNAGQSGRPLKSLVEFEKLKDLAAGESRNVQLCLTQEEFQLANMNGDFALIPGQWTLIVGDQQKSISV